MMAMLLSSATDFTVLLSTDAMMAMLLSNATDFTVLLSTDAMMAMLLSSDPFNYIGLLLWQIAKTPLENVTAGIIHRNYEKAFTSNRKY